MPSLSSMRSLDPSDSVQPLGPPIRQPQGVAIPLPKPTSTPGVVQMPDGKLATNLPLPPQKPAVLVHDSVCWDEPKADPRGKRATGLILDDIEPTPTREPQVGDWLVVLSGQLDIPKLNMMVGGCFQVAQVMSWGVRMNGWSFCKPAAGTRVNCATRFAAAWEIPR